MSVATWQRAAAKKKKCKFFFSRKEKKGGWVCAHTYSQPTCSYAHLKETFKIISSTQKHPQCHLNLPTPNQSHPDLISPLTISQSLWIIPPSSGLTCVAACGVKGVCVWGSVCECVSRCCRIAARRLSLRLCLLQSESRAAACLAGGATGS